MKIYKNKNGITLIALVITIVITLLISAIAIQLTLGENGLLTKSTQAKIQQARAELYDIAKLEYLNLKTKALELGLSEPQAESVLSETNFLNKYSIVGDNITNKKGEVIETKENLIKFLKGDSSISHSQPSTPPASTPTPSVPGLAVEDIDKLVLKLNIKTDTQLSINISNYNPINTEIVSSDGSIETTTTSVSKTYTAGTYTLKFRGSSSSHLFNLNVNVDSTKASIDVINWGKNPSYTTSIKLSAVDKISSPEPKYLEVNYYDAVFSSIPENLYANKTDNLKLGSFTSCHNLTNIPENLFKPCINVKEFTNTFKDCKNLENIPENLFKYNTKVSSFSETFIRTKVSNIPENLFKYNTEAEDFSGLFAQTNITGIPENLFKHNVLAKKFDGTFHNTPLTSIPENLFKYNINATSFRYTFPNTPITSIPENLFKYNTKASEFFGLFAQTNITSIPENLFKFNPLAEEFDEIFDHTKITSIPENLFKYNPNAKTFKEAFGYCRNLINIPENLFINNNNITTMYGIFKYCNNLTYIPPKIIKKALSVPNHEYTFVDCTKASNYNSLPAELK